MFVIRQRQLLQTGHKSGGKAVQLSMMIIKNKSIGRYLTALALGLFLSSSLAYAAGTIHQVRVGQDTQKTRIVFDLKEKTNFQVRMLNNPSRVMVVFNRANNNISFHDKTFNDSRLYKMQVRDKGEQTRVTMQLHKTLDISSFHLGENAKGFNRLVIDLKDAVQATEVVKRKTLEQARTALEKSPAKQVAQKKTIVPKKTAEKKQEITSTATPQKQPQVERAHKPKDKIDKSVDILLGTKLEKSTKETAAEQANQSSAVMKDKTEAVQRQQTDTGVETKVEQGANEAAKQALKASVQKIIKPPVGSDQALVIALDAGHGGKDPGAVNRQTRIMEKDVTLKMAKQLQRQINAQPNMRAVLIRENDVFIPLYERQKIAKRKGADIFISIHADAFKDESVHGGSVYVLSRRGASSHMARLLAKSENAYLQDVKLSGFDDDVAYALSDLSRRSNIDHSQKLAKSVLLEMDKKMTMHRSQVQSAQFAVLKAIDMPSMLIETAFISNPNEARNLVNPLFQKKMANAIVSGLSRYIAEHRQAPAQTPNTLFVRYKVKTGDNLTLIAKKFNVTVAKIKHHNRIRNANRLYVGKRLRIPVSQDLLAKIDQIS